MSRHYKEIVESQSPQAAGGAGVLSEYDRLVDQMYRFRGQNGMAKIVTVVFAEPWHALVPSPFREDTVITIDLETWAPVLPEDYLDHLTSSLHDMNAGWIGFRKLWRWLVEMPEHDAPPLGLPANAVAQAASSFTAIGTGWPRESSDVDSSHEEACPMEM